MAVVLKPHQEAAVKKLSNGKILYGGTGVGKSITAMAYYMENEAPKDIYVMTTAKKRNSLDWEGEAAKYGVGSEGATTQGVLHVDSWNNIGKYTDVHGAFFIFDEQRLVGSGAWTKAFLHIAKSNNWIMLSATPGDTWLDYIPVFVANGFYKNRTEFKRRHVVYNTFSKFPKVDRYLETGTLVKHKHALLVHMPYERHTTRHARMVEVSYDQQLFERVVNDRWHVYEDRPLRDIAEQFLVMRKVVNTDPSRLEAVRSLLMERPRLIVFYNFNYELEMLRTLGMVLHPDGSSIPSPESPSSSTSTSLRSSTSGSSKSTPDSSASGLITVSSSSSPNQLGPKCQTAANLLGPLKRTGSAGGSGSETTATSSSIDDPWYGTIWEKGWDQEEELRKYRESIPMVQAKAEFEIKEKRSSGTSTPTSPSTAETSSAVDTQSHPQCPTTSSPTTSLAGTSTSTTTSSPSSETKTDTSTTAMAEWNGQKHQEIPNTRKWVYLVQYAAGAEGWNCVSTDSVLFFSQTYSYKLFHQAHGRIDRLNTPFTDLYYYHLMSKSKIDIAIRKALNSKRSFNEKNLGKSLAGNWENSGS